MARLLELYSGAPLTASDIAEAIIARAACEFLTRILRGSDEWWPDSVYDAAIVVHEAYTDKMVRGGSYGNA